MLVDWTFSATQALEQLRPMFDVVLEKCEGSEEEDADFEDEISHESWAKHASRLLHRLPSNSVMTCIDFARRYDRLRFVCFGRGG